jgi:hypothetical protein
MVIYEEKYYELTIIFCINCFTKKYFLISKADDHGDIKAYSLTKYSDSFNKCDDTVNTTLVIPTVESSRLSTKTHFSDKILIILVRQKSKNMFS